MQPLQVINEVKVEAVTKTVSEDDDNDKCLDKPGSAGYLSHMTKEQNVSLKNGRNVKTIE